MPQPGLTTPDNDALPWQTTLLLALQHVLVVAATPITSVFLIAKALHFTDTVTASVLSATFLMCGLGAILQSLGVKGVGARLPFIMVPGGAPIAIFVAIALQTNIQTAIGAVILTSLFYFIALPIFRRCLHHFPPFIIGIMLLMVSINLIRLYGGLIIGQPGSADFAHPTSIILSLGTILITLIFALAFSGILRQLAVMFGLLAGTLLGGIFGTSLIITSGENIGVVRTTNVKSRFVTAAAGGLLILIAIFAPLVRLATCLPGSVVCGTAVIVFSIIGVIGIDMIAREPLHTPGKTYALAMGLAMGMLPILVPGLYQNFPAGVQMVFGNGMAAGTLTAILVNSLFNWSEKRTQARVKS
ncbi:uracil-xanthine permease [Salmonella enterica subsp. enterica]|nr:uracil-xanthine permease [Salmonella enterica subsp. enterica]